MSFGQTDDKNLVINPGAKRATGTSTIAAFQTSASINQIRGLSVDGNTGSGIPSQVTNVSASVSNATAGATSVVTVIFRRDPSDSSFSTAKAYVRGYNGNPANVLIASGAASPISFVLNNTGENISILVQASGNSGDAPLSSCPTTGVKLPKSVLGGFGATTTTTNTTTVVAVPSLPARFDYLFARGDGMVSLPSATYETYYTSIANVSPTATEPSGRLLTGTASASTYSCINVGYNMGANPGQGFCSTGSTKSWTTRVMTQTSSGARYWLGFIDLSAGQMGSYIASICTDAPNYRYVAFRYSAGTDSTWKLIAATDATHQTVVDTGVAINTTASTLFQLVFNGGASIDGYINGTKVATVASNLPAASYNFGEAICCDNKNTATAVNLVFYWMQTLY